MDLTYSTKSASIQSGIKLKVEWNVDRIVLYEAGYDQEVQLEETRLIDLEELKQLRGGVGEGYRQSIQSLLLVTPEGLIFKEIVTPSILFCNRVFSDNLHINTHTHFLHLLAFIIVRHILLQQLTYGLIAL